MTEQMSNKAGVEHQGKGASFYSEIAISDNDLCVFSRKKHAMNISLRKGVVWAEGLIFMINGINSLTAIYEGVL